MTPKVISFEGIIGAGKSTLLEEIRYSFGDEVVIEPFDENPILPLFYENPDQYAALCQMVFFRLRARQLFYVRSCPQPLVFIERSIFSDRYCFGEMLRDAGHIKEGEWKAYTDDFEFWCHYFNLLPDVAVFVDEDVDLALERIKKRDRPMERGITREYLVDLRGKHLKNLHHLGNRTIIATPKDGTELEDIIGLRAKGIHEYLTTLESNHDYYWLHCWEIKEREE